jgi:hypothetical protein
LCCIGFCVLLLLYPRSLLWALSVKRTGRWRTPNRAVKGIALAAVVAAGSRQPDGSVEATVSFKTDGGSAKVKMIQPYGAGGIWIVQDAK